MNRGLLFLFLMQFSLTRTCFCQDDSYQICTRQPTECGGLGGIGYPFSLTASCGYPGFLLSCQANVPRLNISSLTYRLLEINNSTQSVRLSRDDLWDDLCPPPATRALSVSDTISDPYSTENDNDANVTLFYRCPQPQPQPQPPTSNQIGQFNCGADSNFFSVAAGWLVNAVQCPTRLSVPVNQSAMQDLTLSPTQTTLQTVLRYGFWIRWSFDFQNCTNCVQSGGFCGHNQATASFACFCVNGTSTNSTCTNAQSPENGSSNSNLGRNIALPIAGAVLAGVGLGWLIFRYKHRRKQHRLNLPTPETVSKDITTSSSDPLTTPPSSSFNRSIPSYVSSNSDFAKDSAYLGVQVFDYAELEQATTNFSRELGDGGFGTVYYGVLPDGRIVAVKLLFESNFKRVEQFLNEVKILARLAHKNLVKLYGCTSRRSRELLLVYEYIPNGTVADHLNGKRAKSGLLTWPIRLNIAIQTADALTYLHQSEIIHRDVKTNNILLDNDFHVKVADFGLSRLFPNDVTHVSTAPQGTPGYVDPEYYQCYQLTEKSDVYSFGVVLIELISSLPAVDTNRHRHDINLANMAINKIQNHVLHEMVEPTLGFEMNSTVRRMITQVAELAFRCLQHERETRPSMQEVLEALQKIQNENMDAHKVEVVDILVDGDTEPLKSSVAPSSPDSVSTVRCVSSSAPNSS